MPRAALLALLLASCSLTSGRSPPAPAPTQATLFFTADLRGYVEPCGCSENMRGGLSRLSQVISAARAEGPSVFFFDSGNGLFPVASVPEPAVGQQERKAKAVAEGLSLMGLTARAPGPLDDARGTSFHRSLSLPEVQPATIHRVDVKGHALAVVSGSSMGTIDALAETARREGAVFVVALVPSSLEATLPRIHEAPQVDLILASQPRDELSAEQNKLLGGQTKLAQVQNKGRSLLRVDLVLRDAGRTTWLKGTAERDRDLFSLDERIELTRAQVNDPSLNEQLKALRKAKLEDLVQRRAALAAEPLVIPEAGNVARAVFVPVEASVPREPRVAEVERAYNADVGQLNLKWAKENGRDCEPPSAEKPGFTGSASCGGCHPEALAVWQKSKHPLGYQALAAEGKQYHLDCISCHVSGWQQPGGVCRVDKTAGREEVGCESCHGPGSRHLAVPIKDTIGKPNKETCVKCHDHENSPHFDFDTWLPRVRGPGHGLPK